MYSVYRLESGVAAVSTHKNTTTFTLSFIAVVTVGMLISTQLIGGLLLSKKTAYQTPVSKPKIAQVASIAPVTAPEPIEVPDNSADVAAAVKQALSANTASAWAVSVYDITDGRSLVRINDTTPMDSASLYKLYAALALSKKLDFSKWSSTRVGGHSVSECVDLMLRISDNPCGEAIAGYVGWNNIDSVAKTAGYSGTVTRKGVTTTAADTTAFMSDFYQGKLFDPETTTFIATSLAKQKFTAAIPAGCGCTVMNKTGNDGLVAHDSAIMTINGHTYATTIMSTGGSYGKIANIARSLAAALNQP